MKKFGIDISRWQNVFDFDAAMKDGIEFVIIKGGGGDSGLYTDSRFERNYEEAKKHGLPVGVYWFSKALTVEQAKQEAEYFYTHCLIGKQFELPVYIDVENKTQLAVGKRLLTDIVKAWCDHLEKRRYWVGIYSSKSYFKNYLYDEELSNYAHWVASWTKTCTYTPAKCFGMWQFGGETNLIRSSKIAGVTCDQDYMLIDYPAMIKANGLNGFGDMAADKDKQAEPVISVTTPPVQTNTGEFDNVPDEWAKEAVDFAVKKGILYGDENGNYNLHKSCTRQEMLVFLYRLYKLK